MTLEKKDGREIDRIYALNGLVELARREKKIQCSTMAKKAQNTENAQNGQMCSKSTKRSKELIQSKMVKKEPKFAPKRPKKTNKPKVAQYGPKGRPHMVKS